MISKKIKVILFLLIIGVFNVFIHFVPSEIWGKDKTQKSEILLTEDDKILKELNLEERITKEESKEILPSQIYISSNLLEQGDTLFIKINNESGIDWIKGEFGSTKIDFFKPSPKEGWIGIIGISVKQIPGKYNLVIQFSNGKKIKKEITVIKRKFPIKKLLVTRELEKKGFTPPKIKENISKENLIIEKILSLYTPEAYFNKAFINPLKEMKIVGAFGDIRKSGDISIQHLGVDLEADIGTPVYAINNGLVRFSQELPNYGKTLIIDHGFGIFSLYLHLDKFKVSSGDVVQRGDVIGFSGNTGYSIEPHLHFSVRVNGVSVDPLRFIETIGKEFKEEISKKKTIISEKSLLVIDKIIQWGHYKPKIPRFIDTIIIHSSYNALGNDPYSVDGVIYEYKIYGVAPHYLIDRNGNIFKLVEEENIAYHAGGGKMPDGRTNINDFSIGIELIYHKNETPNEIQYQKLVKLVKNLKLKYKINYILGHKDIVPFRKTDPWNFDWQKFNEMLK